MAPRAGQATAADFFGHCEAKVTPKAADDKANKAFDSGAVVVVYGGKDCGKTSLLLQYGLTKARAGQEVVLVLYQSQIEVNEKPSLVRVTPCSRCGQPRQDGSDGIALRRIQIKYLESALDLQRFVHSFHLVPGKKTVLLIDDLDRFFVSDIHKGALHQFIASLYELQRLLRVSHGHGDVVLSAAKSARFYADRFVLLRWCSLLDVSPEGSSQEEYLLTRDFGPTNPSLLQQHEEDEHEESFSLRFRFRSSSNREGGVFQLLRCPQVSL